MQVPVLLAIDDYPALTLSKTDYGTGTSEIKRRQLSTSELRLAVGLQLMTRDAPKLGLTVCAAHASSSISPLQPVPLKHAALLALQRYTRAEVQAAMSWYTAQVRHCWPLLGLLPCTFTSCSCPPCCVVMPLTSHHPSAPCSLCP